ncbi:hypothetical protein BDQ12DRAFT_737580 [Crucibulum laeve]|uniref:Uncharacterized protein n=1 Tax=Crucibulum laeve TaxID=68775 RepID=A0A5C3LRH3_9AGAR|nr:hypothetical protein BDQ12DRAFT_737580 [Crucibulum laeve]
MTHHLNLIAISKFTVPHADIVLIIVDNSDLQTRTACSRVNKEWAGLLRGRIFGPHLTVTADQFSKLLATISDLPLVFNNVLQYTKGLTVIDNDGALNTEDMIALCTPHAIEAFSRTLSLELNGPMTFTSFTSFTKFVFFFPALDTLSISNVRWKENSSTMHTDIPILHSHHRGYKSICMCLDLSRMQINTVLLWLLASNTIVDVRVLKIDLTFMLENDHLLRTTSFNNLRTLQLSNINPLLNVTNDMLISVLRDQIKSTLEYLTLTIFAYNKSHLERLPWWMICTIITDQKEYSGLKQLEIVVLDIENPYFWYGVERFLQRKLAPFVIKDMLSIKFHDSF